MSAVPEPVDSPTARALLTLELVQSHPGITADRIAHRLGVTPRAARRYVAILREAGIPVDSVSGPAGGYRPGRGMRPAPMVFTAGEALGLVMAVLDGHHAADDPDQPVGKALAKLLRNLPESVSAQADSVRRNAASAPDRGAPRPDPDTTVVLVRACADHHLAQIGYRTATGRLMDVTVEPWAVVVRHSRWYLLCGTERGARTYRVDRVTSAVVLDETFEPPADLDPVASVETHLASGWEFEVEVRIEAPVERVERLVPRTMGRIEAVDDATSRLVGTTGNPHGYAADLAGLSVPFRVEVGGEVRAAVRAIGGRLLAAAALTASPSPTTVPSSAAAPG